MRNTTPAQINAVFTLGFIYTATGGVSDWLGITTDVIYSNASEYTLPFAANLIGMSYGTDTNNSTSKIEFHSASTTATSTTRQITWTISSHRNCYSSSFTPIALSAGDRVMVYYASNGATAPNDLNITLYFQITSFNQGATGYSHSGSTTRTSSGGATQTV